MRVEFHPEALAEFRAAAEYYETQQTGLGERFANAVEAAVAHIVAAPKSGGQCAGHLTLSREERQFLELANSHFRKKWTECIRQTRNTHRFKIFLSIRSSPI